SVAILIMMRFLACRPFRHLYIILFLTGYFAYTVGMSTSFKRCGYECMYDFFGQIDIDKPSRNAHYICVIMLACQRRNFILPSDGCTDSLMFISRDGNTISASTDQDA